MPITIQEPFFICQVLFECEKIKLNDASNLSVAALFAWAMVGYGPIIPLRPTETNLICDVCFERNYEMSHDFRVLTDLRNQRPNSYF